MRKVLLLVIRLLPLKTVSLLMVRFLLLMLFPWRDWPLRLAVLLEAFLHWKPAILLIISGMLRNMMLLQKQVKSIRLLIRSLILLRRFGHIITWTRQVPQWIRLKHWRSFQLIKIIILYLVQLRWIRLLTKQNQKLRLKRTDSVILR